ncbi:MAG: hypothetical protein KU29_10790 [Sulfurovum sp. FS06-10]|nr:MAG: hypothetical protein KU29_10790 [Sulfurovum sp. FS06-10]
MLMKPITNLFLDDFFFIGEGRNRKCYEHPEYKHLCIKISSKKGQRSAQREVNYFKRLHKRGKSFEMISDFKGTIKTNLGEGYLYELVRDYDGSISKNLEQYLSSDEKIICKILTLIEQLRHYLIKEDILFSDLAIDNILVQQLNKDDLKLIVIDGIGDNNQIPFLEYFKPLGIKRSIRKWDEFKATIAKDFPKIAEKIAPFSSKLEVL